MAFKKSTTYSSSAIVRSVLERSQLLLALVDLGWGGPCNWDEVGELFGKTFVCSSGHFRTVLASPDILVVYEIWQLQPPIELF